MIYYSIWIHRALVVVPCLIVAGFSMFVTLPGRPASAAIPAAQRPAAQRAAPVAAVVTQAMAGIPAPGAPSRDLPKGTALLTATATVTNTSTATPTDTPTATDTPTDTPTGAGSTGTPTATPTATDSATPTATDTATLTPVATDSTTATPSATATATGTFTPTDTPTPTPTPTGTGTGRPKNTATRVPLNWLPRASLPISRALMGGAAGLDGRIYVIGGVVPDQIAHRDVVTNSVMAYAPVTDTWSTGTRMPTARYELATARDISGTIYALGGANFTGVLATVETYNPAADTWQAAPSMPTARYELAAAADTQGNVYAIGGCVRRGGAPRAVAKVEQYNPGSNTWRAAASLPTARCALAAATGADGRIYVMGGSDGHQVLNTVDAYIPTTNTWIRLANMPTGRSRLAAVTGSDGLIYAIGGVDNQGNSLNTVEALNPKLGPRVKGGRRGVWSAEHRLPQRAYGLVAVVSPAGAGPGVSAGGQLYALGGHDIHGKINDPASIAPDFGPIPNGTIDCISRNAATGPRVTLSSASGVLTSTITITGTNFAPNAAVIVYFITGTITSTAVARVFAGTADAAGQLIDGHFRIPNLDAGTYKLRIVDKKSKYPVFVPFTVLPSLRPLHPPVGDGGRTTHPDVVLVEARGGRSSVGDGPPPVDIRWRQRRMG